MTTGSRTPQHTIDVESRHIDNDRLLELSPEETRRSSVQIRPAPPTNPKILNVLLQLENNNASKPTINNTRKYLSFLSEHANLNNPEEVKQFIKNHQCSDSMKRVYCITYNRYTKYYKVQWEKPRYKPKPRPITIPTREKVEMLIANAKAPLSLKLQISAETGFRPIEVYSLRMKDVDLEHRTLSPETAKNGNPRTGKISLKLKEMLTEYIINHKLQPNDKLFKGNPSNYGNRYQRSRNALAEKLHDPTIKTIRLYDLRHYYGTMEYHKTKDLIHVMHQMGHKVITTTMIYMHILNEEADEWTCKATNNTKDATTLVESGFEYIATTPDGLMLFRKRK